MASTSTGERFARWVYGVACVYGVAVLLPQYFMEGKIGRDYPPPITHPEHFYGFIGIALAWQIVFAIIAARPVRFRIVMLPAILEKLAFGVPAIVLYVQGRLAPEILAAGLIDLFLGSLFAASYLATRGRAA